MGLDVLHVFPSFAPGGIQMRLRTLTNALPQDWSHAVVALDGTYSALASPGWPETVLTNDTALPETGSRGLFGRMRVVSRWLRTLQPDVLVTNNWGAMEWAAAANLVPSLGHLHTENGFGPDEAFKLNPRRNLFRRLALRRSDSVLLCSQTLMAIARDQWGLPKEKTAFVPDGIDVDRFDRSRVKAMHLPNAADHVRIGCVAPLRAEKNLTALLEAFDLAWKSNSKLDLHIAGDGPEAPALKEMAKTLASRAAITFHGFIETIEQFFAAMDICALSSDTEQLPNAILQAMAMECPIAAFAVGDIPTMTAPDNAAYLPQRRDIHGLSQALIALAGSAGVRESIGAANREKCIKDYTQTQMADHYRVAIERAARGRGRVAA